METMAPADGETVEVVDGVHLTQLVVGEHMSVQHFHVEPGAVVPVHSHHHEQAGYIAHGAFTFYVDGEDSAARIDGDRVEGEEHVVSPGESYLIPGGQPHAAENRADVPVDGIDVFSPPRENPDWSE